jgi:RNA polymerase sigma-70 factor (ECF subfamily)
MQAHPDIRAQVLAALPNLRAFAISLTNSGTEADDLIQETLVRAWGNLDRFEAGTNMNAWLFTILRNNYHSQYRRRRREVEDIDDLYSSRVPVRPDQGSRLEMEELWRALGQLSPNHREVLLLIGAEGLSYAETARICDCTVGTVKSRVSRARERLAQLMCIDDPKEIGPDRLTSAALQSAA